MGARLSRSATRRALAPQVAGGYFEVTAGNRAIGARRLDATFAVNQGGAVTAIDNASTTGRRRNSEAASLNDRGKPSGRDRGRFPRVSPGALLRW